MSSLFSGGFLHVLPLPALVFMIILPKGRLFFVIKTGSVKETVKSGKKLSLLKIITMLMVSLMHFLIRLQQIQIVLKLSQQNKARTFQMVLFG